MTKLVGSSPSVELEKALSTVNVCAWTEGVATEAKPPKQGGRLAINGDDAVAIRISPAADRLASSHGHAVPVLGRDRGLPCPCNRLAPRRQPVLAFGRRSARRRLSGQG